MEQIIYIILKCIKKYWKQILIGLLVLLLLLICDKYNTAKKDNSRLKGNQTALIKDLAVQRLKDSTIVAEKNAIILTKEEFKNLYNDKVKELKELGIKLKDVQSYSQTHTQTTTHFTTTLYDTVVFTNSLTDTLRCINYNDGNDWISIKGCFTDDSTLDGTMVVNDTISQIISIIPKHKFLWWHWGVKGIKQTIHSYNPFTNIKAAEYIEIER